MWLLEEWILKSMISRGLKWGNKPPKQKRNRNLDNTDIYFKFIMYIYKLK